MTGPWAQAREFLLTAAVGVALAAILHLHHRISSNSRLKGVGLVLYDLVIWIIFIAIVFASLLIINRGEVRFYVLLALLAGAAVYLFYLMPVTRSRVESAALLLVNSGRKIARLVPRRPPPAPPADGENE